ncbi:MAG: helix-turn-helix transcriptional regulator [Puia sp.]
MKYIPIRKINGYSKEPDFLGGFSIRDLQDLLGGKDLVHELHRHDFFFILAVRKGLGIHEIDFIPYNVHDNAVFMLRPGQVHKLELKKDCAGFLLEFAPTFYHPNETLSKQRLSRAVNKGFCTVEPARFKKLLAVLRGIFHEFTAKQEGYLEMIRANLDIFFIEFIRQHKSRDANPKNTGAHAQDRFEDFLEQLEMNIASLKRVSQYANLLNLSAYQLNAITREKVGKPASALINERIILEAKRYLLATTNQVKEIADHLGYEDMSYFIRFFKKHAGLSPEAFRKNLQ